MASSVEPNVAEVKENIQQPLPETEVKVESQKESDAETPEQVNWRRFREERAKERKQNEVLRREAEKKAEEIAALKGALEALASKPSVPYQADAIQGEETEDQRIQRKIEEAIAAKEKNIEQQRLERERQEMPNRLKSTFSDFNQICTVENLDYLEYHHPEIADIIKDMPDSFEKWAKVYRMVKKFVPNPESQKDAKRAEKNLNKPQSMSIAGLTQTTDSAPVMLDDKKRAENWARMQRVMKGIK